MLSGGSGPVASRIAFSMAGSRGDRSATSYAAATATATTIGAALSTAGNASHGRRPSTRSTSAPGTVIGGPVDEVDEVDDQRPARAAAAVQQLEDAVEDPGAVVDKDDPVAECLDVLQVVRGEQQRGEGAGEDADALSRNHSGYRSLTWHLHRRARISGGSVKRRARLACTGVTPMLRHINVGRSLAMAAIVAVGTLSTGALPATADQGNGNGRGAEHSTANYNKQSHKSNKSEPMDTSRGAGSEKSHDKPAKAAKPENSHGKPANGDHGNAGGKDRVKGNNGTIKITPLGATDGTPNNHPHVGCGFQIEWYGFDKGDDIVSRVGFAMHAPTGGVGLSVSGPSSVFVGGDAASGAGTATGLDGRETFTLSFDGPGHPKQGYHVKVTVHTPYSQGNDTKTKVFWVQGCEAPTEEPPTEEPPTEEPPTEEPPIDQPPVDQPPVDEPPVVVTPPETVNPPDSPDSPDNPSIPTGPGYPSRIQRGPGQPPVGSPPADVPTVVEAGLRQNRDTTSSSVPLILVSLGAGLAGAAVVSRRRQLAAAARRR